MQPSVATAGQYPIIARLFELINRISEDQLIMILKELLNEKFSAHMFKLVIDMTEGQQAALLERLQKKVQNLDSNERRKHERQTCLVPLTYVVQGRSFEGYILDISNHGVFIDSGNAFFNGQEIIMTFSAPRHQKPLTITGEIVWSGQNGIGVKFRQLNTHQQKAVSEFSANTTEVYQIKN